MFSTIKMCLVFAVTMVAAAVVLPAGRLRVATTIDFLDYMFSDDRDVNPDYYPLEVYERRIREMAAGGIDKIYLRVNVCGLTLYPTRFSAVYGTDGAFSWNSPAQSKRAINTLAKYDPLAETIRLGRKYGLEVWCWENLFDEDSGKDTAPPELQATAEKFGYRPFLNPHYRAVPQCQAMKNPALVADAEKITAINADARKYPLRKIVLADPKSTAPGVKITAGELQIYTSADNRRFTRYDRPFEFTSGRDAAGNNFISIDGLEITQPYIKLTHPRYQDDNYSLTVRSRGQGELYDASGRKLPSVWATSYDSKATAEDTPLDFEKFYSAGFDYRHYYAGFVIGEPEEQNLYFYGVAEFNQPEAMSHRLDKFSELVKYDFDGFMFNNRTHTHIPDLENYGFNPAVIEKFRQRFGRVPGTDDEDRLRVFQIRAEGVADFFKNCKAMTGGRPIYMAGLPNLKPGESGNYYQKKFGPLPWLYERYIADKSIDGIIMVGDDFRDQLLPLIAGTNIKLGVFREMAWHAKDYNFTVDIAKLMADKGLDEVELYETLELSAKPQYYRDILQAKGALPKGGDAHAAAMPPEAAALLAKAEVKEWNLVYDAGTGTPDGKLWRNSINREKPIAVVAADDGKWLMIDYELGGLIELIDPGFLADDKRFVVMEMTAKLVRKGDNPKHTAQLQLSGIFGAGDYANFSFSPEELVCCGNDKKPVQLPLGKPFRFQTVIDRQKRRLAVFIDGRLEMLHGLNRDARFDKPVFYFGSGSGRIGGGTAVQSIKIAITD